MATCERRTIIPEPPPEEFVLRLSRSEAYTLATALMQGICWNGTDGGTVLHSIYRSLSAAGAGECAADTFRTKEHGHTHVSEDFDPEGWRKNVVRWSFHPCPADSGSANSATPL